MLARAIRVAVAAGVAAGVVGGLVAGIGARVAMRWVNLAEGIGASGGPGPTVFTLEGTLAILVSGAIAGAPLGVGYVALRPALVGPAAARGFAYGLVLLALLGPLFFLSTPSEFGVGASRLNRVALFAALFPLYGAALGLALEPIERLAARLSSPLADAASVILAVAALAGGALVAFGIASLGGELVFIYGWGAAVVAAPWLLLGVAILVGQRRREHGR